MLQEELENIVAKVKRHKSESGRLELKAASKGNPKIYDTLSSFSNQSGGGIIIFGIDESNDYQVCGVYDAADLQKKISEQCLQMEPSLRPLCTVGEIDGKTVVSAEVQEIDMSQRPCFYKGSGRIKGSYIRVGDADRQMTEYEVYSYEALRKKTQDELRVTERAISADMDTDAFAEYLIRMRKSKPNLSELPHEKICKLQGFQYEGLPTLAGILLFADYPQAYFPQLCITAVVVPGFDIGDTSEQGERFIDNTRIEGTISQILKQTLQFIRRNIAFHTIINADTGIRNDKTEYPMTAIREIILNALIHRDYSIHTDSAPITVALYRNRLVVENPGGLYGRLTLDTLGTVSADTRNPFIAGAMEVLNETENRFSGIPTIRKSMREYGLPAPEFENLRGVFRVTLYNEAVTETSFQDRTLEEDILTFCAKPRSRKDLVEKFPSLTQVYLMTRYVNPLVEQGLLQLSIPEKPKSKNQRFKRK